MFCFCFMIACVLFSFSLWLHKRWVNFYLSFKRGSAVIGCDSAKAQHTIPDCAIQKIYNMCSSGDPFTHLMDRLFTTTSHTHTHAHVIIEKKDINVRCGVCFDCVWMVVDLVTSECMSWATNACLPARPPARLLEWLYIALNSDFRRRQQCHRIFPCSFLSIYSPSSSS